MVVPEVSETTALGAAYLAGVGTGQWTLDDVRSLWREATRYEPRMGADERQSLLRRVAAGRSSAPGTGLGVGQLEMQISCNRPPHPG